MTIPDSVPYETYQSLKKEYNQFSYIVSHDLSAPLRHIEQFSALLLENLSHNMGEEEQLFSHYIESSVERSQSMLEGLLQLSRIDTDQDRIKKFDINSVLDLSLNNFPNHAIEYHIKDVETLYCDKQLIINLFTLLIENAIKFKHQDRPPRITITIEPTNNSQYLIKVSDNGIGIAPERVGAIFDPFQKLHPAEQYTGIGMGLTFCRKIVSLHNGTIGCTSVPDQGTLISISLPFCVESAIAA